MSKDDEWDRLTGFYAKSYGGAPSEVLSGVYCCGCGVETPCRWEDLNLGELFECPACGQVTVSVAPRGGGKAWVRVSASEVEFYNLLGNT